MEEDDVSAGERRLFSRIPFNGTVTISSDEGRWNCRLLDISLKGALVNLPANWAGKMDQPFQLQISLSDNNVVIVMDVITAHISEECVGFCCTHIDIDSITHLRRLLELNIADEERLNRELSALIFNMCNTRGR